MQDETNQAFALFRAGKSVNGVATKLGIAWNTAKRYRLAYDGADTADLVVARAEAVVATEDEATGEVGDQVGEQAGEQAGVEPAVYDMTIEVPEDRLAEIFGVFSMDEQAIGVQAVLQWRMNRALAAQ